MKPEQTYPLQTTVVDSAPEDKQSVSPLELRRQYESGLSLDVLSRRNRMGKLRLTHLLREAGARLRSPGRALRTPWG